MRELLQDCQKSQVWYEWDFEVTDEYGDVIDHCHYDKLPDRADTSATAGDDDETVTLVLVRNSGSEADGLQDRQWAYTESYAEVLRLPAKFDGGNKVPRKFHDELAKWQGWTLAHTKEK